MLAGNQADVLPWLQSLDVFALPSYANEGVPQALVQAMVCGLPCVTTDVGAIPEVARDGETGVVVPPQDRRGTRATRSPACSSNAEPARAPRRGSACAASRGSAMQPMVDRMVEVFRDAVAAQQSA